MSKQVPTISELVVDGFDEGGFRAEHAMAVAMADASPDLLSACMAAITFLEGLPAAPATASLIEQLTAARDAATILSVRNAS